MTDEQGKMPTSWKEIRNAPMTQAEIDSAYEGVIDDLKAQAEELCEALEKLYLGFKRKCTAELKAEIDAAIQRFREG